jgi:hypothetical protein
MTSHKKLPDIVEHASDCAVHNEPAYPNGPCDCGFVLEAAQRIDAFDPTAPRYDEWTDDLTTDAKIVAREITRLRTQRSDEARPSWDEAIEAAAKVADRFEYGINAAQAIRALPRPSAPAEDGPGSDDQKLDRIAKAINDAMPPAVKRHYAFPLDELRKLARAATATSAPAEDGAGVREALERLADAADAVGVQFFDTDTMAPEVEEMQAATQAARDALSPLHEGKK